MQRLALHIDSIGVHATADPRRLEALAPIVRVALRRLAEQLQRMPPARFSRGNKLGIEQLRLADLSLDELLGPQGAERLADELYKQLLEDYA